MKLLLLLAVFPLSAQAGDLLQFRKLEKSEGHMLVYLEPARMKVDIFEKGEEPRSTLIYREQGQTATIVDHQKKEFTEIDKATVEKVAGKVNAAMGQMKEAFAKLPPGMRKLIEEKMGKSAKAPKPEKVTLRKAGSGETVGKWKATHFEVVKGKAKVSEFWTVPLKEVGVEQKNFAVVKSLGRAFADIGKQLQGMLPAAAPAPETVLQGLEKMEGFPVKAIGKKGQDGLLLENASKKELSAADFAVPEGYAKKTMGAL